MPPQPFQDLAVHPEARFASGNEAQVSAPFRGDQRQVWIGLKCRMLEDLKRDEGVVLGLDQQRGHGDGIKELSSALGLVIMLCSAKSEERRGDFVVDGDNGVDAAKVTLGVLARR